MYNWDLSIYSNVIVVDSNYVGDFNSRRSLMGYVFTLSGYAIY